jgi:acyl-CoA synthetase (AMP-forming)/AMP-acid ligase II
MLLHHILERASEKYPDKKAVWFNKKWKSYTEINKLSQKVANFLYQNGLKRGDRVSILLKNSFDYIVVFFGILKAGGVAVPLNTENKPGELSYLIDNSDSDFLFTSFSSCRNLLALLKSDPVKNCILDNKYPEKTLECSMKIDYLEGIYSQYSTEKLEDRCIDIDLAMIIYTSGSTSKPKGVMLSHLNLISNTRSIAQYLRLTNKDRIMVVLPFFYIYGNSLLLTHFYRGASLVIDNNFTYPNTVLDTMQHTQVTGFAGVPYHFAFLLHKSKIRDMKFPFLRYVTQAGNAMAVPLQKAASEVFAPAKLYIMYGTTEASPRLTYLDPNMHMKKLGSVGKPVTNTEVFIADEEGNPLGADKEGEIAARGSNIMQGYWKDPEGTSRVLKNGLYFTGDIGKMDADGYIYVTDRKREMIKVRGFQVSPREIEDVLLGIKGIREAAVIRFNEKVLGNILKAIVVKDDDSELDKEKIIQILKKHLSGYKIPKCIEFRNDLPKKESGKIDRRKLEHDS